MTAPPPERMSSGMPKRQPRKVPKRSSVMARQNSSIGAFDHVGVLQGGAAGVVVQHVEPAVMRNRLADGGLQAVGLAHVGRDGDGLAAGGSDAMRGLLAARRVDLGDDDAGALAGEQLGGGAADAGAGAGDEGDLAGEPAGLRMCHGAFPSPFPGLWGRRLRWPRAPVSSAGIEGERTMARQLYELCGTDPARRFSPYCWRSRMALAHKGLEAEVVPWRFTDTAALAFAALRQGAGAGGRRPHGDR